MTACRTTGTSSHSAVTLSPGGAGRVLQRAAVQAVGAHALLLLRRLRGQDAGAPSRQLQVGRQSGRPLAQLEPGVSSQAAVGEGQLAREQQGAG